MSIDFSSPRDKYFFKLAILVMIADLEPHETEYELIYKKLTQKTDIHIDSEDFHEVVDEVIRNVYENRSAVETAERYANLIEGKQLQFKVIEFCEEVLWADGLKKPEEVEIISKLREIWAIN